MLSVVIPCYNDKYLDKTIRSLLWNKKGDIEIIPVLDGTKQDVYEHHRVHPIYLGKQQGMRNAINTGVRMARGELIMKCDAHCKFAKGFDVELKPLENEVMIPRRYQLDTDKWEVMDDLYIDYERLIIHPKYNKFHGEVWRQRQRERKNIPIDETMAFQGSCWVMHKTWFEKLGLLDDNYYRSFGHESLEISMKTWQAGGRLLVNKKTWYAHQHNKFKRTHRTRRGSDIWAKTLTDYGDYYEQVIKPRFGNKI